MALPALAMLPLTPLNATVPPAAPLTVAPSLMIVALAAVEPAVKSISPPWPIEASAPLAISVELAAVEPLLKTVCPAVKPFEELNRLPLFVMVAWSADVPALK